MDLVKGMSGSAPFPNDIYMLISNQVMDLLVPSIKKRQKYLDYFYKVMIPEMLIRLYASVNGIGYSLAEKEMRYGPQYDGPIDKHEVNEDISLSVSLLIFTKPFTEKVYHQ